MELCKAQGVSSLGSAECKVLCGEVAYIDVQGMQKASSHKKRGEVNLVDGCALNRGKECDKTKAT